MKFDSRKIEFKDVVEWLVEKDMFVEHCTLADMICEESIVIYEILDEFDDRITVTITQEYAIVSSCIESVIKYDTYVNEIFGY